MTLINVLVTRPYDPVSLDWGMFRSADLLCRWVRSRHLFLLFSRTMVAPSPNKELRYSSANAGSITFIPGGTASVKRVSKMSWIIVAMRASPVSVASVPASVPP